MIAAKVARLLLEVKAVRLRPEEPFTWSSGWKSPIYCDNRITLSYPEARTYIRTALADTILKEFPDVQAIAGVATAGIAQGALVADALNLPFLYVRPEPKKHGMGNQIEGRLEDGQRVVVIEDLISTGGSSLKVVDVLRQAGAGVLGMAAIFTYGFPVASQNFADKDVKLVCLSDYETLVGEARDLNYISADAMDSLAAWRQNPAEWNR
ncbi:orotate phosphoribosyltransferase [Larkinella humicola]|uniref:Orotate phosphoribosyltransferase n=1 Tax=Larkinella humicola TaxID=2607654 RepID=A0A5N1JLC6_9BACT|nr:orotate phosphoribosyltransferase [Larkinella humicola]KAA9356921.1 orotate phosphoribosyltransferase [Larkinella humicola]